ncbi:F-box protein At2g27310-like [Andrographis paniculata]|uniref:F-box protein At2g27310-like n=1 Tax=Andrographis paniculata TaxID=175694 RepID=UPI0021E7A2EF|nr:F-box protein At2g27310-like [Andrographis paniculata]
MDSTAAAAATVAVAAATVAVAVSDVDGGGDAPITALHPDIIQSHILNRLDGPTLAAAGCSSAHLLSLCADDHLWKEICNTTWPSTADSSVRDAISAFPSGHRSFYSDSFPAVRCDFLNNKQSSKYARPIETSELISAVDIYYEDTLLYSKVLRTETSSSWFANSPFRLDLFECNETVATPLKFDGACTELAKERLRVSWILINPSENRAINVASANAVDARRHWLTEGIQLRFATVSAGEGDEPVQLSVSVTSGGKDGGELQLREVSLQVEDMEGRTLTGRDSMVILQRAMEGQRCKSNRGMEKGNYEEFLRRKELLTLRTRRRENLMDTCCMFIGLSIFLFGIWLFFLMRR